MENEQNAAGQPVTDLDAIMKDGLEQFNINLDEGDDLSNAAPQDAANPAPGPAAQPPAGDPAADPAASFRFKTHEEAERGYKELQQMVTTLSEEKKSLLARQSERDAAEARAAAEAAGNQEFLTFATARRAQVLDEIDALDPDTPDYRTQVSEAYARADLDIYRKSQSLAAEPPALPNADEQNAANAAAQPPASSGTADDLNDPAKIRDYVNGFISSESVGLEKDDPLFWTFAGQAPEKDESGQPVTLDNQIAWAVEQTKQYTSKVLQRNSAQIADNAHRRAEEHSRQEMPLARAGANPTNPTNQPADDRPVSLSDALDYAKELRRL